MGQQRYEDEIQRALREVAGNEWRVVKRTLGGLRYEADVRAPARLLERLPFMRSVVGRRIQAGATLTHRLDLRIPPGPHPEVVTIHDLAPLRFPDEGHIPRWALRRVDAPVICGSEFAAQEVRDLLGARDITVIPHGVSEPFLNGPRLSGSQLQDLGIRQPFLVFAAGSTRRKNLPALAKAWRLVHSANAQAQLVMCGRRNEERSRVFAGVSNVVAVGYLETHVVASLMRTSAGVVVPSTYEGFGLPALEGMACGVPVVAANRGALPEVGGDAVVLCEPDPSGLAEAILAVLDDDSKIRDLARRGRLRALGFTWTKAALQHTEVYRGAA